MGRRSKVTGPLKITQIRLPVEMYEELIETAERSERSLNAEMIFGLRHWLNFLRNNGGAARSAADSGKDTN